MHSLPTTAVLLNKKLKQYRTTGTKRAWDRMGKANEGCERDIHKEVDQDEGLITNKEELFKAPFTSLGGAIF
jgi:hypothetical protein